MNEQMQAAALQSRLHPGFATHGVDQAAALLHRLFCPFDRNLALRLWEGTLLKLGRTAHRVAPKPRSVWSKALSMVSAPAWCTCRSTTSSRAASIPRTLIQAR